LIGIEENPLLFKEGSDKVDTDEGLHPPPPLLKRREEKRGTEKTTRILLDEQG